MDDSDSDTEITSDNNEKFKTLEKRTEDIVTTTAPPTLDNNTKNVLLSAIDNIASMEAADRIDMEGEADDVGSDTDIEMSNTVADRSKAVARSALFGDEMEHVPTQMTKPVILQHRVASIASPGWTEV